MAEQQFVTFYLGDDLFGINILLVREINRNLDITGVARSPSYVKGLMNLRGQIVTVLDLAHRLGIATEELADKKTSNCIVLKTSTELERGPYPHLADQSSSDNVGLFVDRIGDVITVEDSDIEPPAVHQSGVASRFIRGVVKLQADLLLTLEIKEVLDPEEAIVS